MVDSKMLREYLGLNPDTSGDVLDLCLAAARSFARDAGIPEYANNAQYDLLICAIAGNWFDHRSLTFAGTYTASSEENMRRMLNAFVLQLRHATEDPQKEPESEGEDDG